MGEQGYKMLLEKASKVREWCDNQEYREKFRKVISKQISEEKLFTSLPKTYGDAKEVHIGIIINSMFPPEKPDISKQHERLPIAYYLLTILHDKIYEYDDLVTPISVDIWSLDAEWIETLWEQMKKSSIAIADGDAVFFDKIDYALQLVEKDLSKTPAETELNTAPAKRRRIKRITSWIFKGFIAVTLLLICLYVFGVVTGIFVFASVLTCLHLLGYLEQFNALIDKIPWPK